MATEPASYGYPKASITADKLPVWQQPLSRFSVAGPSDWRVSVLTSIDRGIRVEAGMGSGDAVTDVTFDYETMSLPTPPTAAAWYLIVRRRNWSGTGTSTLVAIPGSDEKKLPTRRDLPGEESDQPLALVRVTQKDRPVQEIIDLRCWASNGGMEVMDRLALSYLETPGAEVKLGSSVWRCESKGNGVWGWQEYPLATDTGDQFIGALGTSFSGGWRGFSGGGYSQLAFRREGKHVQIWGAAASSTPEGVASIIAVMPVGLRPTSKVPGVNCEMNPDGALRATNATATNQQPSFHCSYFTA